MASFSIDMTVLVATPGPVPEMPYMAAGLARAGVLREYVAPVHTVGKTLDTLLSAPILTKLHTELARRQSPEVITPQLMRREATTLELFSVAARRAGLRHTAESLMRLRNYVFDHRARARLLPTDTAAIGVYTSARALLTECRRLGVHGYLNYSIAHHRYAEQLLMEEAQLQPDFAETLQFNNLPTGQIRRMDEEIELADTIFVLSSFQRETFEAVGVAAEKLVTTPLGVDLELFHPGKRVEDGKFRVLFVGQIGQRKGLSYLLDACRRAAIPSLELLLVGAPVGPVSAWAGLDFVRHVPHVSRWELPELYAEADVYVLPSLVEGFPLTALEAMASGLPAILSENTFAGDVVTDGRDGMVIPIRDAQALAERLRELYERPELRRSMGRRARRRAELFSWERYGERITEVLGA